MALQNNRKLGTSLKDRVKQRAKEADKKTGGNIYNFGEKKDVPFLKTAKSMALDILPYIVTERNLEDIPKGEEWFRRQFYIHYGVGPEKKIMVCPRTAGEKWPICEYRSELFKQGADQSETDAIRPQLREVYNVIDTNNSEDKIQLYVVPRENFGKKLDEEVRENENDDVAAFPYLEGGYTISARMSEEIFAGKTFLKASRIDFKKRDYNYPEETLNDVYDLNTIFNIHSYDEVKAIFLGVDTSDDSSDSEPEKRRVTRAPRETAKPAVAEPEEIVDDDEPDSSDPESSEAAGVTGECPFDYTFGVDCNTQPDCEDCKSWGDCLELHDKLEEEAEAAKKNAADSKKAEPKEKKRVRRDG